MKTSMKRSDGKMIILDTNFIIYSVINKINIVETVREKLPDTVPVVTDSVIQELEGLSHSKSEAAVGLRLVRNFPKVTSTRNGDDGILEASLKYGLPVITNDRKLSSLLRNNHIRVYSLRDRRYLEVRK
ncbi:MAG: hypothetical protein M1402_02005 [Candidatus Thermoplasmatota archaeon]|nr:hypothetical protein [Candidatus Thermoplasmatota archaeon]